MPAAENEGISLIASVVSCVIALGSAFFAWLNTYSKHRHDVEMRRIDGDIQNTKEVLEAERVLRAKLQADHSKCEGDHNETKIKLASLQGRMSALERKVE